MEIYKQVRTAFNHLFTVFAEALAPDTTLSLDIKLDKFLFTSQAEAELDLGDQRASVDPDQELLAVCNEFSQELLEVEEQFYRNGRWNDTADWCKEKAEEAKNLKSECLLPIGWGTGWRAKTVGRRVQKDDEDLFVSLAQAYRLGKGDRRRFPISRKIVLENGRCLPMGWVRLKPDP